MNQYDILYKIADRIDLDKLPSFSLLFKEMIKHKELTQKKKEKYGKWIGKPMYYLYKVMNYAGDNNEEGLFFVAAMIILCLFFTPVALGTFIGLNFTQSLWLAIGVLLIVVCFSILYDQISNPVNHITNSENYCQPAEFLNFVLKSLESHHKEINQEKVLIYLLNDYPSALENLFAYSKVMEKSQLEKLLILNFKNLIGDHLNQIGLDKEYQKASQNLQILFSITNIESESNSQYSQFLDGMKKCELNTLHEINKELESVLIAVSRDNKVFNLNEMELYFKKKLNGN